MFQIFSQPIKATFQRSLAVLFAIGFVLYLDLGVNVPRIHALFPKDTTLALHNFHYTKFLRDCHPLRLNISNHLKFYNGKTGPITPHLKRITTLYSVWSILVSLAVTNRISILISFPPGTKMFLFPR